MVARTIDNFQQISHLSKCGNHVHLEDSGTDCWWNVSKVTKKESGWTKKPLKKAFTSNSGDKNSLSSESLSDRTFISEVILAGIIFADLTNFGRKPKSTSHFCLFTEWRCVMADYVPI